MAYIDIPVETEPVDLAEDAFAYIEGKVPGWLPSPGNLEAWLIESLAQTAGELRQLASLVPTSIFRWYGESVLGLAPYPAVQATGRTVWTAVDDAGYTVNAGTLVALSPPATSDSYAFEVVSAFTIPAGSTWSSEVAIRALQAGAAASGITGAIQMIDPLDFIVSVELQAPTTGGSDAESDDSYLARLSALLVLLSPRPILPGDFSALAAYSFPQVGRATAIDLYNADTGATNVPRCVTVAIADAQGEALDSATMAAVRDFLRAEREVNFLVYVVAPTYTTIDVTVDVTPWPGYQPADVASRLQADLEEYLSPAGWGVPPSGDSSGQTWVNINIVRWTELIERANRTDGVHWVNTLTFGVAGSAQGTADVALAGVAPLPRAGNIVATSQLPA